MTLFISRSELILYHLSIIILPIYYIAKHAYEPIVREYKSIKHIKQNLCFLFEAI
jgi:hypothetical protein